MAAPAGVTPGAESFHVGQQGIALDVPGEVVDGAAGGQYGGAAGGEGQAHQALSGDVEGGLVVRGDFDDAALAGERGGYVEVTLDVESQPLGAAQTAVVHAHAAVGVDLVHAVEAGSGGSGDEQAAVGAEGEVIGRDAGLQGGIDEDLAVAADLE